MTRLTAAHLTLAYNGWTVVRDVSLGVSSGELLGLIGPNGSGKTSVLRALAGLHRPARGALCLDGRDVSRLPAAERARAIGLVPQGEHYAWPLTVEEVVLLGRAAHRGWLLPFSKADYAVVERALVQTNLLALRQRRVDQLSGGEHQRTLIARALAQEPKVLLLDEPTANLDLHYQMQILDLVSRLAADQQLAVVVAIHDLTLAARYCDRLLLLRDGQVFACGAPHSVLTPENLQAVFGIDAQLYRDPRGQWAISVKREVKALL
jgi:iron complex transport system ATP-binding protein